MRLRLFPVVVRGPLILGHGLREAIGVDRRLGSGERGVIRQGVRLTLSRHQNRLGVRPARLEGHPSHLSRHSRLPGHLGHPALPGRHIRLNPVGHETPNAPGIPVRHMAVIGLTTHPKQADRVQGRHQVTKSKGMASGSWNPLPSTHQWVLEVDPTPDPIPIHV